MNAHPLLAGLRKSPDYFLHNLDFVNRRGLVIRTSSAIYRRSAFLDQRMFGPDTEGAWFALATLLQAAADLPARNANYLFHVGHCGSTLLSRLFGELPGCFALREPLAFLALAMTQRELGSPVSRLDAGQWQALFEMVMRLQARCYAETDTAFIKATSAAGNLLQAVLAANTANRAILLHLDLQNWLATMLRAEDTRESVRAYAGAWLSDFRRLTGDESLQLHALDDVRQAVLGWTTMLLNFTQQAARFPQRICWVNFDDFLAQPEAHCERLAAFLQIPAAAGTLGSLIRGPLMQHYAKDPRQSFNVGRRAEELAGARRRFAAEIRAGLRWFNELASHFPAWSRAAQLSEKSRSQDD